MIEKLNDFFLEEEFILRRGQNLYSTIFIHEIYGELYGLDGEFDMGMRGLDHNNLYVIFEGGRVNFEDLMEIIAIIAPEEQVVYYSGNNKLILKAIDLLEYKIEREV